MTTLLSSPAESHSPITTTYHVNSPKIIAAVPTIQSPHSSGISSSVTTTTENFSSTLTFTEPPPSEPESVVSSTSKSFLECQKLIAVIICLIIIIIYTQFIFFYFSSNDNYIQQPIFTKYVTNSSLFLCVFIAIPLWNAGTRRMLLERITFDHHNSIGGPAPITPVASVEDGGLMSIPEDKTDFVTIDKTVRALLNNKESVKSLSQRYRVPLRNYCSEFGSKLKFGILFGFIGLSTGILWIWMQNHHAKQTTTTAILLDECIYFIITLCVVVFYIDRATNYKFNWIFILCIAIICIGMICVIIYYVFAQISHPYVSAQEFILCIGSGCLFGIFISSIDYVSNRYFYFHNVFILFGDILFMIGLYGFVVLFCLWPSILMADLLGYGKLKEIQNIQWFDISINTVIDFIFNIALFLCIALGNALFVAVNVMICLIIEIVLDILTNHQDILQFHENDHISRIDNNDNILHLNWRNWECDLLLFGILLLIIGIISLNILIIRDKQFSRLYCYQSCYYCCSHTRYNQFSQRNKNGIALQCHNRCCKCIWWLFCFPCCRQCCCCNQRTRHNVQYINRTEQMFYKYGDSMDERHVTINEGRCCCCCRSNKYEIVQVNPSTKNLSKQLVNQLMI